MTNMIIYGSKGADELPTGMYLGMLHGRDSVEEDLDGWGYNGIVIPIRGYHTTYADNFRIELNSDEDINKYFPNQQLTRYDWVDLEIVEGCLKYDNKFYGDWTVYYHEKSKV